jgi:FkbM family methyltransferase
MKVLLLNDLVSIVAGRDGYFMVNPKDIYIGNALIIYGEYNGHEAAYLKRLVKPGDNMIEVGANIGSHTVGLAKAIGPQGRLIAFEPQRSCYAFLQAQIALNQLDNVIALDEGIGSQPGQLWYAKPDYTQPGNFGGVGLTAQPAANTQAVDIVRLDDRLGDISVALIKIDVEGMEEEAVRGGMKLIEKSQPILYVENDRVEKSRSLITLILQLGYRLWWHVPPLFNADNFFGVKNNVYGTVSSFNMICSTRALPETEGLLEIKSADDPHPLSK